MCKILKHRFTKCWRPLDAGPDYDEFAPDNLCNGHPYQDVNSAPNIIEVCEKHEGGVPQYENYQDNRKCVPIIECLYIMGKCRWHGANVNSHIDAEKHFDVFAEENNRIVRKPKLRISTNQVSYVSRAVDDYTTHIPQMPYYDLNYRMPNYNPTSPRQHSLDHDNVSPGAIEPSFETGIMNPEDPPEEWMDADLRPVDLLASNYDGIGDRPRGQHVAEGPSPTIAPTHKSTPSFTESEMARAEAIWASYHAKELQDEAQRNRSKGASQLNGSPREPTPNQPQVSSQTTASATGGAASQNNASATGGGGSPPPPPPPHNPFDKFSGGYRKEKRRSSDESDEERSSNSSSSDRRGGGMKRLTKRVRVRRPAISGAAVRTITSGPYPSSVEAGNGSANGLGITGLDLQNPGQTPHAGAPPAPEQSGNNGTGRAPSLPRNNATGRSSNRNNSNDGDDSDDDDSQRDSVSGPSGADPQAPVTLEDRIESLHREWMDAVRRELGIEPQGLANRRITNTAMFGRLQNDDLTNGREDDVLTGLDRRLDEEFDQIYRDQEAADRQEIIRRGDDQNRRPEMQRILNDRVRDGRLEVLIEWGPGRSQDQAPWTWAAENRYDFDTETLREWNAANLNRFRFNPSALQIVQSLIDDFRPGAEEHAVILREFDQVGSLGTVAGLYARSTWQGETAYLVRRRVQGTFYFMWLRRDGSRLQVPPSDHLLLWDSGYEYDTDPQRVEQTRVRLQASAQVANDAGRPTTAANTAARANDSELFLLSSFAQVMRINELWETLRQLDGTLHNREDLENMLIESKGRMQPIYDYFQGPLPVIDSIETDDIPDNQKLDEGGNEDDDYENEDDEEGNESRQGENEIERTPSEGRHPGSVSPEQTGASPTAPVNWPTPPYPGGPEAALRAQQEAIRARQAGLRLEEAEINRARQAEVTANAARRQQVNGPPANSQPTFGSSLEARIREIRERHHYESPLMRDQNANDQRARDALLAASERPPAVNVAPDRFQLNVIRREDRDRMAGMLAGLQATVEDWITGDRLDDGDEADAPHDDEGGAEEGDDNPDPPQPRAGKHRKLNNGNAAPATQGRRPHTRSMGVPTESQHHMNLRPRRRAAAPVTAHVAPAQPPAAAGNATVTIRRGATNTRSGAGRGTTRPQATAPARAPATRQPRGRGRPATTSRGNPRGTDGVQKKAPKKKPATMSTSTTTTRRTRAQTRRQAPMAPARQANITVVVPPVDPNWLAGGRADTPTEHGSNGGSQQASEHSRHDSDPGSDHGSPRASTRSSTRSFQNGSDFIPVPDPADHNPANFNMHTGYESPDEGNMRFL